MAEATRPGGAAARRFALLGMLLGPLVAVLGMGGARAAAPAGPAAAPNGPSASPEAGNSTAFPSVGRFEILPGNGRYPPLLLDTESGTTWSLEADVEPNGFGWTRIGVMDASAAAEARTRSDGARRYRSRPDQDADLDHVYRPPLPPGLREDQAAPAPR